MPRFVFMSGGPPPSQGIRHDLEVVELVKCEECHVHCAPVEFESGKHVCSVCRAKVTPEVATTGTS